MAKTRKSRPQESTPPVTLKRAYETAARGDGYRVLVERLWPRGMRKEDLVLDEWAKAVAPSTELRKWYAHQPERWPDFQKRYREELKAPEARAKLKELVERAAKGPLTLVFSSKEADHSCAAVLKKMIVRRTTE